ncbi:MAG: hypothetical protein WAT81_01815 [Candidatus Moraniibacteriota bacterium]
MNNSASGADGAIPNANKEVGCVVMPCPLVRRALFVSLHSDEHLHSSLVKC